MIISHLHRLYSVKWENYCGYELGRMWKEDIMEYLHFLEGAEERPEKYKANNINSMLHSCSIEVTYVPLKAVLLHAMEVLGVRGGIAPTHSRPRH
jgi:hypothetical protein